MLQVYKTLESALQYPVAGKSLRIFKGLVKNEDYVATLMRVFKREMIALQERGESGDVLEAVMALMEAKRQAKSKL